MQNIFSKADYFLAPRKMKHRCFLFLLCGFVQCDLLHPSHCVCQLITEDLSSFLWLLLAHVGAIMFSLATSEIWHILFNINSLKGSTDTAWCLLKKKRTHLKPCYKEKSDADSVTCKVKLKLLFGLDCSKVWEKSVLDKHPLRTTYSLWCVSYHMISYVDFFVHICMHNLHFQLAN